LVKGAVVVDRRVDYLHGGGRKIGSVCAWRIAFDCKSIARSVCRVDGNVLTLTLRRRDVLGGDYVDQDEHSGDEQVEPQGR
jgi:hypothetical protein